MRTGTILFLAGGAYLAYHILTVANAARQLKVGVQGLRYAGSSLTQTKFIVTLNVYNPNNVALSFDRIYSQVKIEGHDLGEVNIASNGSQKVKPLGDTTIDVPVMVDHFFAAQTIIDVVEKIANKQKFTTPFDVQGTLYFSGFQIPFGTKLALQDFGIGRVGGIVDCLQCML